MYSLIVCLAATAVGADSLDYGWQRMPDGEMQYIIQLDPQRLDALRDGRSIESDIPPSAGDVRSYRIIVGRAKLPHDTPPVATPPASLPALTPQAAKPLAQRTAFMDPQATTAKSSPAAGIVEPDKAEKPWLPLTFTLLGLFASLGGNVYLCWIAWDARRLRQRGMA